MKVWIDDERAAPVGDWLCLQTFEEARVWLSDPLNLAKITRISFDHDLGYGGNGYDLACLVEKADHDGMIPPGIEFTVHSANMAGAERIAHALQKVTGERWQSFIVDYIRLCHDEEEKLGGRG